MVSYWVPMGSIAENAKLKKIMGGYQEFELSDYKGVYSHKSLNFDWIAP